jgi:hypothetical protein
MQLEKIMMACQEVVEACLEMGNDNPEKTWAGLEEIRAVVNVFNKMDTRDSEATVEWHKVQNEETNMTNGHVCQCQKCQNWLDWIDCVIGFKTAVVVCITSLQKRNK